MRWVLLNPVLAVYLAASVAPVPAHATDQPSATPTIATTQLTQLVVGRMAALVARQTVESRLDIMLDGDAAAARLLPVGSPARQSFLAAAISRAQQKTQGMVRPMIPQFMTALDGNMTTAQISAVAGLFATPTGKRIIDRVVSEMLLSGGDDTSEMSDQEARSLLDVADVPALIAVEKSGAFEAFGKAMDALPESEENLAIDLESIVDALLYDMLAVLKTPSEATTIANPAHPIL